MDYVRDMDPDIAWVMILAIITGLCWLADKIERHFRK